MPVGVFVPSRIHIDYPEWQAPLIGNVGQVRAYDGTGYVPVALDFDPTGTAAAAVAAHVALSNPHSQYYLASGVSAYGATLASAADAAAARTALALGTAAVLNVGTGANQIVQLDGSARLPAVDGSQLTGISGGSGSPGGSTTQVQYNNAGAFAGDAGMTYNASTDRLTVTGGLVAPRETENADVKTSAAQTAIIDAIPTPAEIDTELSDNHGDGSWEDTGAGLTAAQVWTYATRTLTALGSAAGVEFTYTVTDSATTNPIADVSVWFSTNSGITNVVWYGSTDAFGVARDANGNKPRLDSGTYYILCRKTGFSFTVDTETVS